MEHRLIGITLGFTWGEVLVAYGDEMRSMTSSVTHTCGQKVYFNGDIWNHYGWYICPHCGDPGLISEPCSNSMSALEEIN